MRRSSDERQPGNGRNEYLGGMRNYLLCGCLVLAAACRPTTPEAPARKTLSLQYIDSAVKPGDNFYKYANGKWLDTATVPATESGAGSSL